MTLTRTPLTTRSRSAKPAISASRLLGCLLEHAAGAPDARDHFLSEQADILDCFPMRHVPNMQVQDNLAALCLFAPERYPLGDLFGRAKYGAIERSQKVPGDFSVLHRHGRKAFAQALERQMARWCIEVWRSFQELLEIEQNVVAAFSNRLFLGFGDIDHR